MRTRCNSTWTATASAMTRATSVDREINDLEDSDCDGCAGMTDSCPGEGNLYTSPPLADDFSCGDYDLDGICNSLDVCWAAPTAS